MYHGFAFRKSNLLPLPHIILWVAVGHEGAAQGDAADGLLADDGYCDGRFARFPDADAAVQLLGGVVGEGEGEVDGDGLAAVGFDEDIVAGTGFLDAGDGQVGVAAFEKPALQNQFMSRPAPAFMLLKKSGGSGCLPFQLAM